MFAIPAKGAKSLHIQFKKLKFQWTCGFTEIGGPFIPLLGSFYVFAAASAFVSIRNSNGREQDRPALIHMMHKTKIRATFSNLTQLT